MTTKRTRAQANNFKMDKYAARKLAMTKDPVLWGETHLQDPMEPTRPLRLRTYQRDIIRNRSKRKVLRMGRRCIAEDDIIYTTYGPMTVKRLYQMKQRHLRSARIYTFDMDTLAVYPTADFDITFNDYVPTLTITTSSGKQQTVSKDHPFLIYKDDYPDWVEAQDIVPGMLVGTVDTYSSDGIQWEDITNITANSGDQPTYDLHVPQTECFVGNGIIQHNTGKTIALAVEICWKAATKGNTKILLVAAYESQVDDVFNNIKKMLEHSPIMKSSVLRTKKKPNEVELTNGSVIMGMVASTSIRGKCLPKGTKVILADESIKNIEDIKVGDLLHSTMKMDEVNQLRCMNNSDWFDRCPGKVTNVIQSGKMKTYRLTTTTGRIIEAGADHRFFVRGVGWTPVSELQDIVRHGEDKGDYLGIVNSFGNLVWSRLRSINYAGEQETYDLTVGPNPHYIAYTDHNQNRTYTTKAGATRYYQPLIPNGGFLVHNSATDLYIDEADYVDDDLMAAEIIPIGTTLKTTTITMSSTPSGSRDSYFYKACTEQEKLGYKEFHIPSTESPEWTEESEVTARNSTTEAQYEREYLALWGSRAEGVYRPAALNNVMSVYAYDDLKINKDNHYYMGVDWNDANAGVQVIILEYSKSPFSYIPYDNGSYADPNRRRSLELPKGLRVFRSFKLSSKEYQQLKAVSFILKLMAKYPFDYCSFDYGYGATNWENLRLGIQNGFTPMGDKIKVNKKMLDRMETVAFDEMMEIQDNTIDGEDHTRKVNKKNFLVRQSVSLVEAGDLIIPAYNLKKEPVEYEELQLLGQMRKLEIERVTPKGIEVYSKGNDHKHDAYLFALNSYLKYHSTFIKPQDKPKEQRQQIVLPGRAHLKGPFASTGTIADPPKQYKIGDITATDHGLRTREPSDSMDAPTKRRPRLRSRRNSYKNVYKRN